VSRFVIAATAARVAAVLALLVVAGCATLDSRTPEERVKARAQERWDALVKGDFEAAYAFMSPGSQAVVTKKDYAGSLRRDFWKSARVEKVTCPTALACEVDLTIEYVFQGRRTTTPLRESWIKEGSNWWYVDKS
jgi:hypothetical protein